MKVVPCISGNDWKTTITLKKKDSKLWYWEVFHIPTTRKNKERWQDRISKIRNEPIKSGTDLNDITEWGEYELVTDRNSNCLRDMGIADNVR